MTLIVSPPDRRPPLRAQPPALLLVALIIYLGAEEGGFFPEATAAAAVALAAALILRTALAKEPFAGFGLALALAAVPLVLLAVWTLVSALWSEAPGRALVEFNRVLLYVLALLFFGSYAPERSQRERTRREDRRSKFYELHDAAGFA